MRAPEHNSLQRSWPSPIQERESPNALPRSFPTHNWREPTRRPVVCADFSSGSGLRADEIILVMAAGAATRLIAPLLSDKRTDPGVVVVDDAGRFAISLIGGHRAEANLLAERVAAVIGAQAVTTTAAEALGLPSVESLAREQGWTIENDGVAVTRLAAAIVNGEPIGTLSHGANTSWWTGPVDQVIGFRSLEQLSEANIDSALVVTDGAVPRTYASNLDHWVIARPRTLVVGVGCSTGASPADVEALVLSALDEAQVSPLSVSALASIDRRADEPGFASSRSDSDAREDVHRRAAR